VPPGARGSKASRQNVWFKSSRFDQLKKERFGSRTDAVLRILSASRDFPSLAMQDIMVLAPVEQIRELRNVGGARWIKGMIINLEQAETLGTIESALKLIDALPTEKRRTS
jgi:hypothetical protein